MEPFVVLEFSPLFYSIFVPIWGQTLWRGRLWSRCICPCYGNCHPRCATWLGGLIEAWKPCSEHTYHPSQNHYITAPHFWTLQFGCRNLEIKSQNCLGIILGRHNSYRGFEWFPYCNFWQNRPLGESISGSVTYFLHLRNWQRIICVIVSGQMVIPQVFCTEALREPKLTKRCKQNHLIRWCFCFDSNLESDEKSSANIIWLNQKLRIRR